VVTVYGVESTVYFYPKDGGSIFLRNVSDHLKKLHSPITQKNNMNVHHSGYLKYLGKTPWVGTVATQYKRKNNAAIHTFSERDSNPRFQYSKSKKL
jgi:hypothetical protein